MQGLRPLFLLRCRLAPKQASASRHRRRNSLRTSGLHHSKENLKNRLARCAMSNFRKSTFLCILLRQPVLKVFFVSAPRFDEEESAICGLRAVRGEASHKPPTRKWQWALALGADTKRFSWFWLKNYLPLVTVPLTN